MLKGSSLPCKRRKRSEASSCTSVLATVLFDVFLFVLGVGTLWRGLREDRLGVVNSGMLMLAGLIVMRFFDSDLGFVVRGLAFIGVGIGFLVTNVVLIRGKERWHEHIKTPVGLLSRWWRRRNWACRRG